MDLDIIIQLAVALGLGLLVGFQREWTSHVAGIRTFALITIFGAFTALFVGPLGPWIVIAGFVGVAAMLIVAHLDGMGDGKSDLGLTTQISALLMYAVGAAVVLDQMVLSIIVGGCVAVLLHWKEPLHAFVQRIGDDDIRAIIQLVLIALVILPILPNETYGPYDVLNPFEIWLMVVLIVGLSVGGFLIYKFFGARAGTVLGGVLGGIISSTATTVSYSRRTRHSPETAAIAALVIAIASTIVFIRVLLEVAIVSPEILRPIFPPLAAMMGLMAVLSAGVYWMSRNTQQEVTLEEEPSDLKAAIVFGLLYALVLVAVAAAKEHFGDRGLYVVAALSGLTDMDAITLSTAQLIKADRIALDVGWRMILVGTMSNLVFKGAAVAMLGHRRLLWRIVAVFGVALIGGGLLLFFWPEIA